MSFLHAPVLSFESRRAAEMAELIRIKGGEPFVAPALVEAPIEHNQEALHFASQLYAGEFEMVIFLTGVGSRLLRHAVLTRDPEEQFLNALRRTIVVCRGPKPTAVLREWGVPVAISVPEPATWREVLAAVQSRPERSVAVQEYGRTNPDLINGLRGQGRRVTSVPVYQWKLPDDTSLLEQALERLLRGNFQVSLFTTGVQIEHFLDFADKQGKRDQAVAALQKTFVASIGPECSAALRACGIEPAYEPSHLKMGILVHEAALQFAKRSQKA